MKKDIINSLTEQLYRDIQHIGLPIDFDLSVKGFSKNYNGRYDPNTHTVILYPLAEDRKSMIEYRALLDTVVHEVIHHYQWCHVEGFVREKGVMHNEQFKELESKYKRKARQLVRRETTNVEEVVRSYNAIHNKLCH